MKFYQTIVKNTFYAVLSTNQITLYTYPDLLEKQLEPKRLLLIQIIFELCL